MKKASSGWIGGVMAIVVIAVVASIVVGFAHYRRKARQAELKLALAEIQEVSADRLQVFKCYVGIRG